MQNWPMLAMPSRSPHCARHLIPGRACRVAAWRGLQLRFRARDSARSHGVSTARAGSPATLMKVTMSSGARLGEHLLEVRMRVAFLGHRERRADLHRRGAEREHVAHLLVAVDAAGGDQRDARARCPVPGTARTRRGQHRLEVEARIGDFLDARRAEMAAGVARMLDHDGVRQAVLAQPFLEHDADAARIREDRDQRDLREILRQSGRSNGRPAPTTIACAPLSQDWRT